MSNVALKSKSLSAYPLVYQRGRLSVWQKVNGLWKSKKSNPIKELRKMRGEWDRKLPS